MPEVVEHLIPYSIVLPYGVRLVLAIEGLLIVGSPNLSSINIE